MYDLDMPKFIYVQLSAGQGANPPQPIRIRADKIEKASAGGKMVLSIGEEQVGEFNAGTLEGWWIQDEPTST